MSTDTEQESGLGVINYDPTEAVIAELKTKYATITPIDEDGGLEAHKVALREMTGIRTSVEKRRKELKENSLAYGKKVDARAKEITNQLREIEDPIREAKKEFDDAIEAKKQAEIDAENNRVDEIKKTIATFDQWYNTNISFDANRLKLCYLKLEAMWLDEVVFQEFFDEARTELHRVIDKYKSLYKEKLKEEEEHAKFEADKKECEEKQAKQKIEQDKILIENRRIREAQEESQRKIDADNDRIKREQEEAQQKLDDEKAENDRVAEEAREKIRQDNLKIEDDQRIIREQNRRFRHDAEQKEIAEAERLAEEEARKKEEADTIRNQEQYIEQVVSKKLEMDGFFQGWGLQDDHVRKSLIEILCDGSVPYTTVDFSGKK